jgi:hypothetical protein
MILWETSSVAAILELFLGSRQWSTELGSWTQRLWVEVQFKEQNE